jgi:hypothetical protein
VDFSTGCIYLPGGSYSSISGADEIKVVIVDPSELTEKTVREIVIRETGLPDKIDLDKAELCALNGSEDVFKKFDEMKKSGYRSRASIASR